DIANDKSVLWKLLEALNFVNVSEGEGDTALEVIGNVLEHQVACKNVVDIGGVAFFRTVRQDAGPGTHTEALVDGILEKLLRAPIGRPISASPVHGATMAATKQTSFRPATGEKRERVAPAGVGTFSKGGMVGGGYPRPRSRTPAYGRRSVSPEKLRSLSPIKAPQPPPQMPYLPSAIQTYDYLSLNPVDEDMINEFCAIMSAPIEESEREEKLFDILCVDVGAQVFLQRSQLFRAVTCGLSAEDDPRFPRCLSYIETLTHEWAKIFRRYNDATNASSSPPTTMHHTLNVSGGGADMLAPGNTIPDTDYSISTPFACTNLFFQLVSYLRLDSWALQIIKLLYVILPFVRVHVDLIVHSVTDVAAVEVVEGFVNAVGEAVGYHAAKVKAMEQEGGDVEDAVYMREQVVVCALEVMRALAGVVEDPSAIVSNTIHRLMDTPAHHSIPGTVICIRGHGCDLKHTSELRLSLMMGNTVRQAARSALTRIIQTCDDGHLLKCVLPWLQATYDLDDGACVDSALSRCKDVMDKRELTRFWLRALLHRDVRFQKRAMQELSDLAPELDGGEGQVDSSSTPLSNPFVFPPAFLARLSADQGADDDAGKDMQASTFERHVQTVQTGVVNDGWKLSLRAILAGLSAYKLKKEIDAVKSFLNRAVELGLHTTLVEVLSDSRSLGDTESLELVLKALRTLVEADEGVCAAVAERGEKMLKCTCLVSASFRTVAAVASNIPHPDPSIRYNLSRIYFCVLFNFSTFCKPLDRTLLRPGVGYAPAHVSVPEFVVDLFLVYGAVGKVVYEDKGGVVELRNGENVFGGMRSNHPFGMNFSGLGTDFRVKTDYRTRMKLPHADLELLNFGADEKETWFSECARAAVGRIKGASSHEEFESVLRAVKGMCVCEEDCRGLMDAGLGAVLKRFLLVAPNNINDQMLLSNILLFWTDVLLRFSVVYESLQPDWAKALSTVVIPALQAEMDHHDGDNGPLPPADLNLAAIAFLKSVLFNMSPEQVWSLASSNAAIVKTVRDYTAAVLLPPGGSSKGHTEQIQALQCLLRFVSLPGFITTVSSDVIVGIIATLVAVFQSEDGAVRHRSVYRWTAMVLRNLSRAVVSVGSLPKTGVTAAWVWGDHWLVEGTLGWLSYLISTEDEDTGMVQLGLGILSNLILMRGSYAHVSGAVPRFLDVAFECLLDAGRGEGVRKEGVGVVVNFLVTYCRDSKIGRVGGGASDGSSMGGSRSTRSSPSASQPQQEETEAVSEMLTVFDKCGFFERVGELLRCPPNWVAYRCAMSELLLNLTMISPGHVRRKVREADAVLTLVEFLGADTVPAALMERGQMTPLSMRNFQANQFRAMHRRMCQLTACNVLQILRMLCSGSEGMRRELVRNTDVVARVGRMLRSGWVELGQSDQVDVDVDAEAPGWQMVDTALRLLADLLLESAVARPNDVCCLFRPSDGEAKFSGVPPVLQLVRVMIRQRHDTGLRRTGIYFIARVLVLHFGGTSDLGLEKTVIGCEGKGEGTTRRLGNDLYRELVASLLNDTEVEDPVHMESTKLEETQQVDLFIIMSLLGHLFAGSIDAKIAGANQDVQILICDLLLLSPSLSEALVCETLCCLRNFLANCKLTKRAVFECARGSGGSGSGKASKEGGGANSTIVERVVRLVSAPGAREEVFAGGLEILKILALGNDARGAMMKMNVFQDCTVLLARVYKTKEYAKMEAILQLFHNITFSTDAQVHLMRINGLFNLLGDLLSCKPLSVRFHALLVLHNLALLRENKAHFLVDDEFLQKLMKTVTSKSLRLLAPATAVIWALLYDSEKAKVALKGAGFKTVLAKLEDRLHTDYAWYLKQPEGSQIDTYENLSDQDAGFLLQIIRHLSSINNVL
ncbi:hypothetical protein HK104_003942, partial [Borealophlyctis nickersoniae]